MSSEGIFVTNPKGNNRDLEIRAVLRNGTQKKLETLRPGEAARFDRREIVVVERSRPPKLLVHKNGDFATDRGQ